MDGWEVLTLVWKNLLLPANFISVFFIALDSLRSSSMLITTTTKHVDWENEDIEANSSSTSSCNFKDRGLV